MIINSEDGLNIDLLSGMLLHEKLRAKRALDITREHITSNRGYVSLSGGKDSVVVTHLAIQIDPHVPICFFSSDLEYPENIDYIHKLAELWSLNLHIINAAEELSWIFTEVGWFDNNRDGRDIDIDIHEAKITIPSLQAHDIFGPGRLWGLRAQESVGRSHLLTPNHGVYTYKDGKVATSPIWNWTNQNVLSYIHNEKIPINPIYEKLTLLGVPIKNQRVGSFFDGANLDSGRMTWLKRGWPQLYDMIRDKMPRLEEYR